MAQCSKVLGNGMTCPFDAREGFKQCEKHAAAARRDKRRFTEKRPEYRASVVPPEWQSNPTLLPKRPPGRP